ncbi:hypothetical protein B0188_11200 [[Haemophilus] felis]|uniref:Uncharacterized protein n=1 Tax=[Haemophilus] felis TaxID=123822 RepID=A0A1T0ARV2_9PAST|nr:hypothetical protein B0188_11200 [[Haemophilus] felis]
MSGVNESLKNTEWIDFRRIEGKAEQPLVVMGKQELYKPLMYFNGNEHYLDEVNGKYPDLSIYISREDIGS